MTPFYFGTQERRLYGAYDPAAPVSGPPRAAVLCYPWGAESTETHRAMRQLAARLAAAGIHALRFDYYGTGDSGGETDEGELNGWRDDVLTAIEEVRDISGAERVILIGLRLGALLAASAAAERPDRVETVVLWDPLGGRDYLEELRATASRYHGNIMIPVPRAPDKGGYEVFGFPIGPALTRQFAELDLAPIVARLESPALLVMSASQAELAHMTEKLGRGRLAAAWHVPARPCWVDDTVSTPSYVPASVLSSIIERLS